MATLAQTNLNTTSAVMDQALLNEIAGILKNHLGWNGSSISPSVGTLTQSFSGILRSLTLISGARVRELGDQVAATVGAIELGYAYNVSVNAAGVWSGRDVADVCWLEKYSDVAPFAKQIWFAPSAAAGVVPAWQLVYEFDMASGELFLAGSIKRNGTHELAKVVIANNAAATYTVAETASLVRFTGTQAAAIAFTLPAAAAAIDGLQVTISTAAALATATWVSAGATFDGAPASIAANTPIQLTYHHATASWFRSI